jgi:hypothetical protein
MQKIAAISDKCINVATSIDAVPIGVLDLNRVDTCCKKLAWVQDKLSRVAIGIVNLAPN